MTLLLQELKETQDKTIFASLYEHFAPRVKAYMMRLGVEESAAEDLAQEALLRVWRKSALFDPQKSSASTWIFAIARNLRIDAIRKEKRPEIDPNDPALQPAPAPAADEEAIRIERDERIREAFNALPPAQEEVVSMYFFEDHPHSVIAEKLGLPLGTVKSRLRLAFSKVRSVLEDTL
ncbi:MAG: sigma-70 family RNA polymerase sigma factor [Pseudomonadota bacterium]